MHVTEQGGGGTGGSGGEPVAEAAGRAPLRVFLCYAHEDAAAHDRLVVQLKHLKRVGTLSLWSDRCIRAGDDWRGVIDENLEHADVIVLLVSPDFLASDYCNNVELRRAMERQAEGSARVVPVIVRTSNWGSAVFAHLQAAPSGGKPITSWGNRDEAWKQVAQAIDGTESLEGKAQSTVSGGTRPPPPPADPRKYLEWLRDQNTWLDIRGMGERTAQRMQLAHVYTRLSVAPPISDASAHLKIPADKEIAEQDESALDESRRRGTRELHDVLGEHLHAALLGDPGSGKTTFLRFVAQHLARAHLGDSTALEKLGLTGAPPFPVFVRLADVASFLVEHHDVALQPDRPEHFHRFLDQALDGLHLGVPATFLREHVFAGNCMLLLDGLDEVPGDAMRQRIVALIQQVVLHGKQVGNRHLITCRTRAYQGNVQLAADVATLHLAPFEKEQVKEFVDSWARALFDVPADAPSDAHNLGEANAYRDDLLRAIGENPSGDTFTESPLMLTVLAVVHWNKRRLPEQRAELYAAAVDYLLESHRKLLVHETPLRRECLQAVAMQMFEDHEGVQRTLGRREAALPVAQLLGCSLEEAIAFLEQEELHSGLLVSRSEGQVEFWHLTFQEYLAALELSPLGEDEWKRLAPHLYDDRWAEVVLLLAGCERKQGLREARKMVVRILGPVARAAAAPVSGSAFARFVHRIVGRAAHASSELVAVARAVILTGRILRDIAPYGGDASQGTAYEEMRRRTLGSFEPGGEVVDERTRIELGEALGRAGDPRLADRAANRVFIPGGTFEMGAQSSDPLQPGFDPEAFPREAPVHRVTISDLHIGRYPVTVAQFAEFVEKGESGYRSAEYWTEEGTHWRADREHPADWEGQLKHPNRPVTSVTWYEADAYARWIGGRLPTEAEWEWVSRGSVGRKYSWGADAPTPVHASFDLRFRAPSPVGIYPRDVHEHGVRDLSGNVWEWCSDWYEEYAQQPATNPAGRDTGASRVLRGGSFINSAHYLRASYRGYVRPEFEFVSIGFRVVWSSAGGQT